MQQYVIIATLYFRHATNIFDLLFYAKKNIDHGLLDANIVTFQRYKFCNSAYRLQIVQALF